MSSLVWAASHFCRSSATCGCVRTAGSFVEQALAASRHAKTVSAQRSFAGNELRGDMRVGLLRREIKNARLQSGECEAEFGAAADFGFKLDRAAVLLYDFADEGEAQAG